MTVNTDTNYKIGSRPHLLFFIFGTLALIVSLTIPDIIDTSYWWRELIEVSASVFAAGLYAYSVRTYLKKGVETKLSDSLGVNDSVDLKKNPNKKMSL